MTTKLRDQNLLISGMKQQTSLQMDKGMLCTTDQICAGAVCGKLQKPDEINQRRSE